MPQRMMVVKRCNISFYILVIWTVFQFIECGPVQRTRREIYPEILPEKVSVIESEVCVVGDVVYSAEEKVPADQPCLRCKCQPPEVVCETIQCEKKSGCRAIHKSNTCCPDYKCDCEHEGRIYSNGERLESKPGTECKVCYCRAGEVQCAEVTCYIRPDCQGRQVEGKCCPKYDHCPPREPTLDRGHIYSTTSESTRYTTLVEDVTTGNSSVENEISDLVKEEEVFDPKLDREDSQDFFSNKKKNSSEPEESIYNASIEIPEHIHEGHNITIHEIIPEIKEIPITSSPKRDIQHHHDVHQLLVEETFENGGKDSNAEKSNDLDATDSEFESSEIAEIYQQPPVLRIGDKLLFLKQGELVSEKDVSTPKTVITVVGAEGLQRGFEESVENKEPDYKDLKNLTDINGNRTAKETEIEETEMLNSAESGSIFNNLENSTDFSELEDLGKTTEVVIIAGEVSEANSTINANLTAEGENASKTIITQVKAIAEDGGISGTTEIFDLKTETEKYLEVEDTNNNNQTMEVDIELPSLDYDNSNSTSLNDTEEWVEIEVITNPTTTQSSEETVVNRSTTTTGYEEVAYLSTSERPKPSEEHKEETVILEQNPEYPPIPDVMSLENIDELTERIEEELAESRSVKNNNTTPEEEFVKTEEVKILPGVLEIRSNKTATANSTLGEWLKTEDSLAAILPDSILLQVAPSDLEDTTTTTDATTTEIVLITDGFKDSFNSSDFSENSIKSLASEATVEPLTSGIGRQTESLEEEVNVTDSGEQVTEKGASHVEMLSTEDASIGYVTGEVDDVEIVSQLTESAEEVDNKSGELLTSTIGYHSEDVEMINVDSATAKNLTHEEVTQKPSTQIVEKIQSTTLVIPTDVELLVTTTESTSTSTNSAKIEKRNDDVNDRIFEQLSHEIDLESGVAKLGPETAMEEESEAQAIFKELLEETSLSTTPKVFTAGGKNPQPRDRESAVLQRVSDAIAKFQLRDTKQSLDTSILGILRDFFSSQYRSYSRK